MISSVILLGFYDIQWDFMVISWHFNGILWYKINVDKISNN
jgi:hypothetical protein